MKIALIGYGQMGQLIHQFAQRRGHEVLTIIDPKHSSATDSKITPEALLGVNVAFDFSHPGVVLDNLRYFLSLKNAPNLLVGTTGWYTHLGEIERSVARANIGFLWSSNFSIGVNLYFEIVKKAAKLINKYNEYDIWGTELHHAQKADSPSGTAKILEEILLQNIERKTKVVDNRLDRKIEPYEIHFSSTRGGAVNFSHTIGLDSEADTITLTHAARNRDGYALGAVQAAEWLVGKCGFFKMEDFLGFEI